MFIERAVNFREALALDVRRPGPGKFEFQPRPELARQGLLCPPAHPATDVPTVNSQVAAIPVDTADDDVNVWIVGVVVVDRSPDEASSEVSFDLTHQPACEFGQVQPFGVLGRDDETKLPLLALQGCPNLLRDEVFVCRIESAWGPVAFDPVAFEIFQVVLGRSQAVLRPKRDVARLDHAAPAVCVRLPHGHSPGSRRPRFVSARATGTVLLQTAGKQCVK